MLHGIYEKDGKICVAEGSAFVSKPNLAGDRGS